MKDLGFFGLGLLVGLAFGAATTFFALGSVIQVKVDIPSEYTIRGGANLNPTGGPSFLIPGR